MKKELIVDNNGVETTELGMSGLELNGLSLCHEEQ